MVLFDDDKSNGFCFIWTIHNFSYCVQKTKGFLESSRFALNSNNTDIFNLALFPRGLDNNDTVGVSFRKEDKTKELQVAYVLSIRTVSGSYKKLADTVVNFSPRSGGFISVVRQQSVLNDYLDNDSLTIRCRIIKAANRLLESEQCYARTTVRVERAIYNWNLKSLGDMKMKELETKKQTNMPEITTFTMNVSLTKGISGKDKFEMLIKRKNTNKLYFSTCTISLLDCEKVIHSVQNEHWFESSNGEQIWTVTFTPKNTFQTNLKQNSTIYLRCEFCVSSGVECSIIEKVVYGTNVDHALPFSKPPLDSDNLVSWKDNLLCLYSKGKFSDLTIQTKRKKFLVHKAVLCAQSTVFSAMFERDMKENRTGIVEIGDLEDDIVSRMLLFVYTCAVENLDWEIASKLYFAADKYEITPLKEKCSLFLKENLNTSNACKCLVLADMHQDQNLKSFAQNFVIEHSTDIISSDEWKKLMEENLQLSAETMHVMCMRNLKG